MLTVVALVAICWFIWICLRRHGFAPKLQPGKFWKQAWNNWSPRSRVYHEVSQGAASQVQETAYTGAGPDAAGTGNAPRRGASVRSIISLPSYSPLPKPEEQIIARAGERGGMDTVVEFPETANEEEARREEEMESLYQIRVQRRREAAEREERRRERQQAREAGNHARLQQISVESIAARNTAAEMFANHRSRSREQRVSSVSYAELGQVRHDGSRIRANSNDSDQRPLLETGAGGRESRTSVSSVHDRDGSTSSLLAPTISNVSNHESLHQPSSNSTNAPEQEAGDVGALQIPPPQYDNEDWGEAPAYESPIHGHGEHPMRLPSIHVEAGTPSNSTPVTPVTPRHTTRFTPSNESLRSAVAQSNDSPRSVVTVVQSTST